VPQEKDTTDKVKIVGTTIVEGEDNVTIQAAAAADHTWTNHMPRALTPIQGTDGDTEISRDVSLPWRTGASDVPVSTHGDMSTGRDI
jgi:hypothetical protein